MSDIKSSNLHKDFITNNSWTLLGQLLVNIQGIILIPLIVKSVGASVYGGYVLVIIGLGFLFGISSFGIGYVSKRYLPSAESNSARGALFYPQFFFHLLSILLFSLLILFLRYPLQNWLKNNNISFLFPLIPLYLMGMLAFSQLTDYFRYTGRQKVYTLATTSAPYLNIGLLVSVTRMFLFDVNVNVLILTYTIALWAVAIPLLFIGFKEMGFPRFSIDIQQMWADLRLGFPLVLENIVSNILNIGDRYILGFFLAVTAVGYYSPAYALGTLIIFFPKVSGVVLPPLLSGAVDGGRNKEAKQLIDYTVRGFLLIGIPFVMGASILSKPILRLLANAEVADNAYLVTPFVAVGTIFYGLIVILSNILFVQKKTSLIFRVSLVAAIANILLNIILLSLFKSIIISGIVTLVSYVIAFITLKRRIQNEWNVNYSFGVLVKALLASVVMAGVLIGLPFIFPLLGNGSSFILAEIAVGVVIYWVTLFLVGGISKKEIAGIWEVISKSPGSHTK